MLVLLVNFLCIIVPGGAAGIIAYRWPQVAQTAPTFSTEHVASGARKHRPLVAFMHSRLSPESTTGLALSAAIVAFVGGAIVVGLLFFMIRTNTGFARLDHSATLFGTHHATNFSTKVLRVYTQLGGALVIVPLAVIVAIIETIRQRSIEVVTFLALVVGGQFLLANVLKSIVNRARPNFDQLTGFSGPSFPSGHAVATAACLAAFALVIGRHRSLKVRAFLAGLAVGLATGIACVRVMLGVHWLTDVLAGLALGWAWFALCSVAFGGYRLRFGAPVETAEKVIAPIVPRT